MSQYSQILTFLLSLGTKLPAFLAELEEWMESTEQFVVAVRALFDQEPTFGESAPLQLTEQDLELEQSLQEVMREANAEGTYAGSAHSLHGAGSLRDLLTRAIALMQAMDIDLATLLNLLKSKQA